MVITNYGKNQTSMLIGGSHTIIPEYFIIGSGSGVALATDTSLQFAVDRQTFTATTYPANQKITQQGDWNSIEMSGIQLQQFGIVPSGTGVTGSIWSKTSLPALTFDGTNELRIEEVWEVF